LIAGDFAPLGGMDCANHGLALYLARTAEVDVHLVAHRVCPDLELFPNVTVHKVARPWGKHMLGAPLLARAGRRMARRQTGARVVVNGGNCVWRDVNWVHYVHAAWNPPPVGGVLTQAKAVVFARSARAAERSALRRARVVVANSERTREALIGRLSLRPERVHTIYYGIDPERFRPASSVERRLARERLGWNDGRPTLAFVGALGDARKGFDTLFEAWCRLAVSPGWQARLAVVGAGATLDRWRREARERRMASSIEFLGFRHDVPEILRACHALVSPTRYEAYGLNVHEAICCGLAALVSAKAGVAERYPEALGDLLIPDPDDAADLAARIGRWCDRAETPSATLTSFSEQLRARTWDHMAEQFVATVAAS
jgi:glycosyltransferase involved in cell wall biosynthesis